MLNLSTGEDSSVFCFIFFVFDILYRHTCMQRGIGMKEYYVRVVRIPFFQSRWWALWAWEHRILAGPNCT